MPDGTIWGEHAPPRSTGAHRGLLCHILSCDIRLASEKAAFALVQTRALLRRGLDDALDETLRVEATDQIELWSPMIAPEP